MRLLGRLLGTQLFCMTTGVLALEPPPAPTVKEAAPPSAEKVDAKTSDVAKKADVAKPNDEKKAAASEKPAAPPAKLKATADAKAATPKSPVNVPIAQPAALATPKERAFDAPLPKTVPRPDGDQEAVPIDWPGVLELSRASSLEVKMAAERVQESHVQLSLAKTQWLPSLNVGSSYLKHEGHTQIIPGQIITASKASLFGGGIVRAELDPQKVMIEVLKAKQQIYAQSGALDRATRQSLQEASLAYVDLVSAQAGAAINVELAELIDELVKRSDQLLKQGVGAEVEVLGHQTRLTSQKQKTISARQNQLAASSQLVQILNLPPTTRLFANEDNLVPLRLVDENRTEGDLITQALDQGPGLAEVVAMIKALDEQKRMARRVMLLPTLTATVGQGTFGGGLGGTLANFNSSTDVGVGAYWDVMRAVGTSRTRDLFESKRRQVMIQHDEVNNKLATGIIVARNSAIQAMARMKMAEMEISTAIRAYQLSQSRLQAAETNSSEVMQAIGALGSARADYLSAVIDYNKSQIQLQYLLGYHGAGPEDGEHKKCAAPAPIETKPTPAPLAQPPVTKTEKPAEPKTSPAPTAANSDQKVVDLLRSVASGPPAASASAPAKTPSAQARPSQSIPHPPAPTAEAPKATTISKSPPPATSSPIVAQATPKKRTGYLSKVFGKSSSTETVPRSRTRLFGKRETTPEVVVIAPEEPSSAAVKSVPPQSANDPAAASKAPEIESTAAKGYLPKKWR